MPSYAPARPAQPRRTSAPQKLNPAWPMRRVRALTLVEHLLTEPTLDAAERAHLDQAHATLYLLMHCTSNREYRARFLQVQQHISHALGLTTPR